MGLYERNKYTGISVLKWDNIIEEYVFDHSPDTVIYYDQEHKLIHIKKDSRFICLLDHDDLGFNSELTIFVTSKNTMLKVGTRNFIRMFQPGFLVTKQSCYMFLRCQTHVSTTSCSIINMLDTNNIQCAHKNKFLGRNDNFINALTNNIFDLKDNNTIQCRANNTFNIRDNNTLITTTDSIIIAGCNNTIICQDNCTIHVDCDNTIITGDNCTVICSGDNNFISCLDFCTLNVNNYSTIFAHHSCIITARSETSIEFGNDCFLIRNDLHSVEKFNPIQILTNSSGYVEIVQIYGSFDRFEFLDFFTEDVVEGSWSYGAEYPQTMMPLSWVYPRGFPDECEGYETWVTGHQYDEDYDLCCPETTTGGPAPSPTFDASMCEFGLQCTGGPGSTGGLGYGYVPTRLEINQCAITLDYAAHMGWFSTYDEYLDSVIPGEQCVIDTSSLCTFDTTCPFDTTSICQLNKFEVSRTVVMTGGTGGTGGTGSPSIPKSHLFVPICG